MIGWLRGRVLPEVSDTTVVLDVGGVGYELSVPLGTLGRVASDADGTVTLHVHTHVREDALELFGFASREERTVFRTLIAISKVGPKLALAMLGAVSVAELAQAVSSGQAARLTTVSGIGKKTAERIILELEGKLTVQAGTEAAALDRRGMSAADRGRGTTLRETLLRMGFKPSEAERAVTALPDLDLPLGELVRGALKILAP